jgi:hypothetical protein
VTPRTRAAPRVAVHGERDAARARAHLAGRRRGRGRPRDRAGTTEPGATVQVGDEETVADDDGSFAIELDEAPEGELALVAIDVAGQHRPTTPPPRHGALARRGRHDPGHPRHPTRLGVPSFRERIVAMIDDGIINSVVLTLKDEGGRVGWNSEVDLAEESGANEGVYDLDEVVADLHDRGRPHRRPHRRVPRPGARPARDRHGRARLADPDHRRRALHRRVRVLLHVVRPPRRDRVQPRDRRGSGGGRRRRHPVGLHPAARRLAGRDGGPGAVRGRGRGDARGRGRRLRPARRRAARPLRRRPRRVAVRDRRGPADPDRAGRPRRWPNTSTTSRR